MDDARSASTSLTVLIADDDPVVLELLDRFFSQRGHTPHRALQASEALALSETHRFDAALVDLHMPGGGTTVLGALQRRSDFRGPLLLMTGDGGSDAHDEAEHGVTEVVRKPFGFAALVRRVEVLVGTADDAEGMPATG